jgi:hypothetical protein
MYKLALSFEHDLFTQVDEVLRNNAGGIIVRGLRSDDYHNRFRATFYTSIEMLSAVWADSLSAHIENIRASNSIAEILDLAFKDDIHEDNPLKEYIAEFFKLYTPGIDRSLYPDATPLNFPITVRDLFAIVDEWNALDGLERGNMADFIANYKLFQDHEDPDFEDITEDQVLEADSMVGITFIDGPPP